VENWRQTNVDVGTLIAIAMGFGAAVLVGVGFVGWLDDRCAARVADRLNPLESRVRTIERRVYRHEDSIRE
jgi:hypothetical protein